MPDGPPPELPPRDRWSELGIELGDEILAGRQSRVFRAAGPAGPLVVKLVDARRVDAFHRHRVEILASLADITPAVVGPVKFGDDLIVEMGPWLVVAAPFIVGPQPDDGSAEVVGAMAETLAQLHAAMVELAERPDSGPWSALPAVQALQGDQEMVSGAGQLIHGDFAPSNLIDSPSGLRVIDFDGCGWGTVAFDVANTLYMAMFDGWVRDEQDHAPWFRRLFVSGYEAASGAELDGEALDRGIARRLAALRGWLDQPATAPIGIAIASPSWHRRLRRFLLDVGS